MTLKIKPVAVVECLFGLGDNMFLRPLVRRLTSTHEVYLDTPWPELYEDLDVKFSAPRVRRLRTQMKNVAAQSPARWTGKPAGSLFIKCHYFFNHLKKHGTIFRALEAQFPKSVEPLQFDLPEWPFTAHEMGIAIEALRQFNPKPLALIRPVTLRREWYNAARNPLPEYVAYAAGALMQSHHVVLAADLKDREEWSDGPLPPHHTAFVKGELSVRSLLTMFRNSDITVGGVGWIVPAALMTGNKTFCIIGGHGTSNAPEVITDPRFTNHRIEFATPKDFCKCRNMKHDCPKGIPNFPKIYAEALTRLGRDSTTPPPSTP